MKKHEQNQNYWLHASMMRPLFLIMILLVCVVISAVSVVIVEHIYRHKVQHIHQLNQDAVELNKQWAKLQVQQVTAFSLEEIETIATEQLNMILPTKDQILIMRSDVRRNE